MSIAIENLPPFQLQTDISSDNEEQSNGANSTTDSSANRNLKKSNQAIAARKSVGRKTFQRKMRLPLKVNSQERKHSLLKNKSNIPRPLLLTPSSSSTSLATSSAKSSSRHYKNATYAEELVLEKSVSVQDSSLFLSFHQRRSITQMDFKQSRRNAAAGQLALVPSHQLNVQTSGTYTSEFFQSDPRIAGLRIFSTIMLNAWRKRRNEVKQLTEDISILKKANMKSKNQLYLLNSLFRVEQKRNEDISAQLKKSLDDLDKLKSDCDQLVLSMSNAETEKNLLKLELQTKEQQLENIDILLEQNKSELKQSMSLYDKTEESLSKEKLHVQKLQNQKNDLISELNNLKIQAAENEQILKYSLELQQHESSELEVVIENLMEQIENIRKTKMQMQCEATVREANLEKQIQNLRNSIETLESRLQDTFVNRMKAYWQKYEKYNRNILRFMHIMAYLTVPITTHSMSWAYDECEKTVRLLKM